MTKQNSPRGPRRWLLIGGALLVVLAGGVTQNPVLMSFGTSSLSSLLDE